MISRVGKNMVSKNKTFSDRYDELTVLGVAAIATYWLLGAVAWFLLQSHGSIEKILVVRPFDLTYVKV